MRTRGDCDANPPPRRVLSAKLNSRAPSSGAHLTFFRSADIFVESRGSDLLIARKPSQAHRKPHRRSNAFVTSQRITGIRAICYIPGVPTYHPALSKPSGGLQARLRGIPGPLPTSRFSPRNSVHPSSAVHPSNSRLPLCYVTNPKAEALDCLLYTSDAADE